MLIAAATDTKVQALLAVAVIVAAARFAGWLIGKVGQPRVCGEIVAGIVLGPSALGLVWPGATAYLFPTEVVASLDVIAHVGLVLFMFLIGLDLDLSRLRGSGHKAVFISNASIVMPMVLGALLALWLHPRVAGGADRLGFTLFIGTAMAITAFPVLARVLQETGLYHTRIGILTVTCAAVNDVTAWCVLAVVLAIIGASGPADVVLIVALAVTFVAAMFKVARPALQRLPHGMAWVAVVVALASAWVTEEIGIHAIFGGFIAGVVMPRRPDIQTEIHDRLQVVTVTVLLPVFFVVVGLDTRVHSLDTGYLWAIAGLVTLVAVAGKWGGSTLAARLTGESWYDANAIGVLMNTRGLTELVILTIGLEVGVITTPLFTMMVIMALVTTLMTTPMLTLAGRASAHRRAQLLPPIPRPVPGPRATSPAP